MELNHKIELFDFLFNKIVYRIIIFEHLEFIFNAKMVLKDCEFPFFSWRASRAIPKCF